MADQQGVDGGLRELALFAGAGGGILGGHLLGWRTVCAVERDPYAASVLVARQNEGILPPFPIWDDVCTFDGRPWRGRVDVVSGGFPCQDFSSSGKKSGLDGEKSGLWNEMARIVSEIRPRFIFLENSQQIVFNGFGRLLRDIAALGYDARWGTFKAENVGAPHVRDRLFLLAQLQPGATAHPENGQWICSYCEGDIFYDCECNHWEWQCAKCGEWTFPFCDEEWNYCKWCGTTNVEDSYGERGCMRYAKRKDATDAWKLPGDSRINTRAMEWWSVEPDVDRVVNGLAHRVDRLRAIGNGQVPSVAALAWRILGGE